MPRMLELYRKKAKPAYIDKRSFEIERIIKRQIIDDFNASMLEMIMQNRRESCSTHLPVFGSNIAV